MCRTGRLNIEARLVASIASSSSFVDGRSAFVIHRLALGRVFSAVPQRVPHLF